MQDHEKGVIAPAKTKRCEICFNLTVALDHPAPGHGAPK